MAYIDINVPYIKEIMKKANLSGTKFGESIGQGENWWKNTNYRGKSRDYAVDMICRIYGADRAKLTTAVPNQSKRAAKTDNIAAPAGNNEILIVIANGLLRVENKLDKLLNALGE